MPIYEHQCECGHQEESLLPLGAPAPLHCDKQMRRLISRPGRFIFKGTGFYATEYGSQPEGLSGKDRTRRSNREIVDAGYKVPKIPQVKEPAHG